MEYALLLAAPIIGILVGLIPSMGVAMALILLYPLLLLFDPIILIVFYAILTNARDFSGSVSAINLGLLGEVNSMPALRERPIIVKAKKQISALKNTMLGSLFGMGVGLLILIICVIGSTHFPLLLRTDVLGLFILITIFFLIFWTENNRTTNIVLILLGFILGKVGWDYQNQTTFLTFGNVYLYGGIPMMPFLLGFYAIPKMFELMQMKQPEPTALHEDKLEKFNFPSALRGSFLGAFCGLIPFIGITISTNLGHMIEQRFYKLNTIKHSLARLTSAETANNAAQVTLLIPLLIIGIAVQSSELILLDMIESMGWTVTGEINWKQNLFVIIGLPIGCIISALLCYNFVKSLLKFFSKHIRAILTVLLLIILGDIYWIGDNAQQVGYYFTVLSVFTVAGFILKKYKIDAVPCLLVFLLSNILIEVISRIPVLYFG